MFSFTLCCCCPTPFKSQLKLCAPKSLLVLIFENALDTGAPNYEYRNICPHVLILQAPIVCTKCTCPHQFKTFWTLPTQILSTKCSYPSSFKRLTHASYLNLEADPNCVQRKVYLSSSFKTLQNASHSFLLQQGRYHRSHLTGHSSAQLSSLNCFLVLFVLIC